MDELLAFLGRERQVLEHLLFRLLEVRRLLADGEARFLHLAVRDLDAAIDAVGEVELARVLLEPVTDTATLQELAAAATPPIEGILHDHRAALGRLAAEIGATIESVSALAEDGPHRLDEGGAARDELDREILVAAYEAVLSAGERLNLPSLAAFLGS